MALMFLCLSIYDFPGFRVGLYERVDLSDDVAFQATNDVSLAFAFSDSPGDVGFRGFVMLHADNYGAVDGGVELPMPAMVDAMFAAGHR